MPSGDSVTYTANCTLSLTAAGTLSNTATVAVPQPVIDSVPSNDSATDDDTISVIQPAAISATKTAGGTYIVGSTVTYTVTLSNAGSGAQGDNPGDEFTDVLPPTLALVSASATSGTAVATVGTNTVTWNGAIPASGSVTVTITATILNAAAGNPVSNQGAFSFDSDGNGTNDTPGSTDDPALVGASDPTVINVAPVVVTPQGVIDVPTLGPLGMVLLIGGLAAMAMALLRRRRPLVR